MARLLVILFALIVVGAAVGIGYFVLDGFYFGVGMSLRSWAPPWARSPIRWPLSIPTTVPP